VGVAEIDSIAVVPQVDKLSMPKCKVILR